jgi:hypothetical protein
MSKVILPGLLLLLMADQSVAMDRASGRKCQMPGTNPEPGLEKCVLGAGSGNVTEAAEVEYWRLINGVKKSSGSDDPDMDGHEGIPPNSMGSGTR